MADLILRELGTSFGGGDDVWVRRHNAGTIARNEFFGAPPTGTAGYIRYWDGTTWSLKPVRYWDGTSWVIKPVRYWDGTAWTLA